MSLRLYLFGLYSTAIIAFGLLMLLLSNVNPSTAPAWIILLFYLTIFLIIMPALAIVGFYLKVWALNREIIFAHLVPTLRQSALVSFTIIGLLFLEQIKALNWWVAGVFICGIGLAELFFRSKK